MSIHDEPSPLAGMTVKVKAGIEHVQVQGGDDYHVEDWWDRVSGKSWMFCDGNFACMNYGMHAGLSGLPTDNDVLYGKVGGFGVLLHISEIDV